MKRIIKYLLLFAIIPQLYSQVSDFPSEDYVFNETASIEFSSVNVILPDGAVISIGDIVSEDMKKKSNSIIETRIFHVRFGPIDAYKTDNIQIGWNNQNRIIFLEVLNDTIVTADGLKLGDTREKVLSILGSPTFEYSDGALRFENIDYELVGMLFHFENNKVSRLILFTYV